MSLSVRGIARHFLGRKGAMSVGEVFFPDKDHASGLRRRATELARQEISFDVAECIYGWTARYEQTWSEITVRIRLSFDPAVTADTMAALQAIWKSAIEQRWSNRWSIGSPGEVSCALVFAVEWVAADAHHDVRVQVGPARSNMTLWDTMDTGSVAAHEFGHMHGNPDEYVDPACAMRSPVATGTVMDNDSDGVPDRLMQRLADNVGSNVVAV